MAERLQLTSAELLTTQVQVVENFRGKEVFPEPPKALLEFIERTSEKGFTFEPYIEPPLDFSQNSDYPGLAVRPNPHFYDLIRMGHLAADSARLSGPVWAAMEGLQKPPYEGGKQLYDEKDPLAPMLEDLRRKGGKQGIEVPDWCRHIPPVSRYGVSALELERLIQPLFAQDYNVAESNVGMSYAAFLYRGNTAHPEWGQTNTAEWFPNNKLRGGDRLLGGNSDRGGLAHVLYRSSDDRNDYFGFRLRVVFPPEKS